MEQAHDGRGSLARTQAPSEQPVLAPQRDGMDQAFDAVVVRSQVAPRVKRANCGRSA